MTAHSVDVFIYSPENLLIQAAEAQQTLGYKIVKFYVDEHGLLSKHPTQRIDEFFLSPSGGTLRDTELNIVLYSAKFDLYKGFGRAT